MVDEQLCESKNNFPSFLRDKEKESQFTREILNLHRIIYSKLLSN